ncbi:hypothetical protein ABI59_00415 [Acidobacteria bacterium Mor1]|nr:hypothetical protein ABI59_00415 [Acidobacteria bacterium Mor1]
MSERPRLGPGHRIHRTVALRAMTLLALVVAGLVAYVSWVAPLWAGDWWWAIRACSLFVLPTLAAAYVVAWLVPPRGARTAAVATALLALLLWVLAPSVQRLAHRSFVELHSEQLRWLSYNGPPPAEPRTFFHCGTWLASLGFDRIVTRSDHTVLAYVFGDSAQGLLFLPEGTTTPSVLLDEYQLRSIEPITGGWHHFTADF